MWPWGRSRRQQGKTWNFTILFQKQSTDNYTPLNMPDFVYFRNIKLSYPNTQKLITTKKLTKHKATQHGFDMKCSPKLIR